MAIDPRQCEDLVPTQTQSDTLVQNIVQLKSFYTSGPAKSAENVSLISNWPVMAIDGYGWNAGMSQKEPYL